MFFILRTIAHFFELLRTFSSRSYENIFTAILKSPFYCALCALAHLTIFLATFTKTTKYCALCALAHLTIKSRMR